MNNAIVTKPNVCTPEWRKAEDKQIAQTILSQMGGASRITIMTGAKRFTITERGVRFLFPQRKRSLPNLVSITLCADDTYRVEFWRVAYTRVHNTEMLSSFDGIHADGLRDLFERTTGLYLHL